MRFLNGILNFIKSFLRSLKNHKKRTLLIGIPLIILIIVFWPRPPKPIETQPVKKTDVTSSISATGSVHSLSAVDLVFSSGGKLTQLNVKKGDRVKAGQVIATLDQRSVQKNLEDKLRDYSKQRNSFDETQENNQNRPPEEALNTDMKRILQNNQYDLEKAVISVELQDLARQQAVLTTPIDGIVTRADVTTAGVNVGPTTTFSVAKPEDLVFRIDIDEADIGRIQTGQNAKVILDAFPDKSINLRIETIDFAAHTTTVGGNAYTVEATMPQNNNLQYRIGMSGDAEIIIERKSNVLVVSLASLTDDSSVYVKSKDLFEKRKVKTGIQSDTEIEIISGLQVGEEVALTPDEAAKRTKGYKENPSLSK
jgi:RND family efflux transporter MFP subunit